MSIISIRTALLEKLNDMQELKAAFDYPTANPKGKYPYAVLTIRDGDGEFADTQRNFRRQGYWIRVYQEQSSKTGQGVEVAEDIAADVMNELQATLDMDTTLSGACKYVNVIGYDASYVNRELDTRVLEIRVDANELVAST